MSNTIKKSINKSILITSSISIAIIYVVIFSFTVSSKKEHLQNEMELLALQKASFYENHIHEVSLFLESVASNKVTKDLFQNSELDSQKEDIVLDMLLQFQEKSWGELHHLFITNNEGDVVLSPSHKGGNHLGHNLSESKHWRDAKEKTVVSGFFSFKEGTHYHQQVMTPIKSDSSTSHAVIVAEVCIDHILKELNSFVNNNSVELFTENKERVVLSVDDNKELKYEGLNKVLDSALQSHFTIEESHTGEKVFSYYLKLKNYPLVLLVNHSYAEFNSMILKMGILAVILLIINIIAMVLISAKIANRISKPIINIINSIQAVTSSKDFSTKLAVNKNEKVELVMLNDSFNTMVEMMANSIKETKEVTKSVKFESKNSTTVASKLEVTSQKLANQSDLVANATSEINDQINSISENSKIIVNNSNNISQNTTSVSEKVSTIVSAAEQGQLNLTNLSQSTKELSHTVSHIAENAEDAHSITSKAVYTVSEAQKEMLALSKASNEINSILSDITDIADQTKLLALNATIEAARAGEAGKGFAVVANEVRQLAQQTNDATANIRGSISAIQNTSHHSVEKMGHIETVISEVDSIVGSIASAVEEQTQTTQENATNIEEVAKGISEVSTAVSHVANDISTIEKDSLTLVQSTKDISEQAQSATEEIAEITEGISAISEVSKNSNAIVLTVSESAEKLHSNSNKLGDVVGQFKV